MLFYNRSFYVGECCEPTTFQWVFYPHSLWFLLFLYLVAVLITCWYSKILFRCGFFPFVGWPCVKGGNNCDVGGPELCYMQCSLDQFSTMKMTDYTWPFVTSIKLLQKGFKCGGFFLKCVRWEGQLSLMPALKCFAYLYWNKCCRYRYNLEKKIGSV